VEDLQKRQKLIMRVSQKVKGFLKTKQMYSEYTEMKLILLFNVNSRRLQRTGSSVSKVL
jgi:hypothetical protein